MSSPVLPAMVSSPVPPSIELLALLPMSELFELLPVALMLPEPVRVRLSTFAEAVYVTEA